MKKVLWLASWYPNRMDTYDGDFIQRHARAVADYARVHVICVLKNDTQLSKTEKENKIAGNLSEEIIYYSSFKTGFTLLDRFISQLAYIKKFRKTIQLYIEQNGPPDYVHVQVAMKAGLLALWIKKRWGIPYIVSEHWTGYLPESDQSFSFGFKSSVKKILQLASKITVVSAYLGRSMQHHFSFLQYQVIPNVVDTGLFFPVTKPAGDTFKLIHVSNLSFQKNCESILRAIAIVKEQAPTIRLDIYGPVKPMLQQLAINLNLQNNVFFKGEVLQPMLAKAMQASDALVLYSRFETFGCVLIEANACGIPVIVSDLEVLHELIIADVNGVFVKENDSDALASTLLDLIQKKWHFDAVMISTNAAEKYNYEKVGKQISELYE